MFYDIVIAAQKYRRAEGFRTDEKLARGRDGGVRAESLARAPFDRYCFALSYRTVVNALTSAPIVGRFHCFPLNYNCWIMPPTFRCVRVRARVHANGNYYAVTYV